MPKTNQMLLKVRYSQYDTPLDLDMGYDHIRLSKIASNLCTVILLWGNYHNKRLPMGIDNSPNTLQQKMNDLFHGLEFICVYTDNIFILTKRGCKDHVQKLN